ncbi:ATP synthase gamma chain [Dirofilaria immitis]|nr:hypothetical protein [Dirofilaria immitis]
MSITFTKKLLISFSALNLTIVTLFYRSIVADVPLTLIIQLMIPLITWQIILGISFLPDRFIALLLDDLHRYDNAAGDQSFHQLPSDSIKTINSHGDVSRILPPVTPGQMSSNFLL